MHNHVPVERMRLRCVAVISLNGTESGHGRTAFDLRICIFFFQLVLM